MAASYPGSALKYFLMPDFIARLTLMEPFPLGNPLAR